MKKKTEEHEQDREVVTYLVPQRPMSSLVPALGTPILQCPSNLDMTTFEGRAAAINAVGTADLQLDDNGACNFLATNYLVYRVERTDPETGELHQYPRTVFYTKDGLTFATTSIVVPDTLLALLAMFTDEDWQAGIPLRIVTVTNPRTKRSHHELRVINRHLLIRSEE